MTAPLTYDFNGQKHTMLSDEIQAIEISGPPHRVQDYAAQVAPNEWPDYTFVKFALIDMHFRPGKTDPGVFPAEPPSNVGSYHPNAIGKPGMIHYIYGSLDTRRSGCGNFGHSSCSYGRERFARYVDNERACPECVRAFVLMTRHRPSKFIDKQGYVIPWTYTEEERRLVGLVTSGIPMAPRREGLVRIAKVNV